MEMQYLEMLLGRIQMLRGQHQVQVIIRLEVNKKVLNIPCQVRILRKMIHLYLVQDHMTNLITRSRQQLLLHLEWEQDLKMSKILQLKELYLDLAIMNRNCNQQKLALNLVIKKDFNIKKNKFLVQELILLNL